MKDQVVAVSVTDTLDVALEALGYLGSEGLVENGLAQRDSARAFVWKEIQEKGELSAAYFRGAVPLVAFVRAADEEEVPAVQRRLWNLSRVPVLITATPTRVGAYSCFVPPTTLDSARRAELAVADVGADLATALAQFSRRHVESGRLAAERPNSFKRRHRVDRQLLENLRRLRDTLGTENGKVSVQVPLG